jgi:hypothetical protein
MERAAGFTLPPQAANPTSVLSLCHTMMALSMGVLSGGPSLLPLAVNVTCHMPTIDATGPGKDLSHFAYVKTTSQRNLDRVSPP